MPRSAMLKRAGWGGEAGLDRMEDDGKRSGGQGQIFVLVSWGSSNRGGGCVVCEE